MIHFENAPFFIGVTGHMDLRDEEVEPLKRRVRTLFRFLKCTKRGKPPTNKDFLALGKQNLNALLDLLRKPDQAAARDDPCKAALKNWPDLQNTPIVVLNSLAPGADTLVAEVALEDEFQDAGFSVLGALPFPHDVYRDASTFYRKGDSENEKRQHEYDRVLELMEGQKQVETDPTFEVLLASDVNEIEKWASPSEREQRFCDDRDAEDFTRRHLRYKAAGEYMAAYAHLLVAFWDPLDDNDPSSEGTAAIVEARRGGMTPKLLPTTSHLTLLHGGPVFHLYTHRKQNTKADAFSDCAPVRWLHPYDSAPQSAQIDSDENGKESREGKCDFPGFHNLDDDDPKWQRTALTLFCRIAHNVEEFNKTRCPSQDRVNGELTNRLEYTVPASGEKADESNKELKTHCFSDELADLAPEMYAGLRHVAAFRRRASDESGALANLSKRTLRRLFLAALFGAVLLHLFAHWHPQNASHGPIHPLLGSAALLVAVGAVLLFWCRRAQRNGERAHDYRALAEGLRVQFYWNLVGLGRSVSANYMQRQRSELDWIRAAIRATSFPYHRWRDWFQELQPKDQVTAIRCALHGWVAEQKEFFHNRAHERHEDLHFWHKLGGTFALAGLASAATLCSAVWYRHKAEIDFGEVAVPWTVFAVLMCAWLLQLACRKLRSPSGGDHGHKTRSLKSKREAAYYYLQRFVAWAIPTIDEQERAGVSRRRFRLRMAHNFLMHLPSSTFITSIGISLCVIFASLSEDLPDAFNFGIVLAGSLLVAGALSVAWAEKNLNSELAYQYHTMESLFASTQRQLEREVEQLQQLAASTEKTTDFEQALRDVQDRLLALGKEALDENAEWLILHRARPLEPVMAG